MTPASVRVWDPLVRLVHWAVALLIAIDMLNEAGANPWHRYLGYLAGVLVLLRLAWGVFARSHAQLGAMVKKASGARAYLASGRRGFYAGHNPLGAAMALTLWALVFLVVLTGWLQQLDAFWGNEGIQMLHTVLSYVLTACVAVHVAGVIATSARYRINLAIAMVTGRKTLPADTKTWADG